MSTLFKNNAVSKLASGISIGATSLTVTAGQGDKFPVVVAPDVALVTLENASFSEIIKITARALGADTMTIVKAQEGTTDRAWLTNDIVSMRATAAQIQLGANAQDVAAAALAAHAAAVDPHPTYTTAAELIAYAQPHDAQLDTLAAITAQQATDLAAVSTFIGTLLNDADQAAAQSTLGIAPAGALQMFATTTAPTGWLKANGAGVPVANYAALTTAIYCGDANNATAEWGYRASDSAGTTRSTTGAYLILPDYRGRFPRAWADGSTLIDSGRSLWASQADGASIPGFVGILVNTGSGSTVPAASAGGTYLSGPGETRPTNLAALVCIKY